MSVQRSRVAGAAVLVVALLALAVAVVNTAADAAATATGIRARAMARFTAALPVPTGPHPVGTVSWHLRGVGRPDPWRPGGDRDLTVQLWYPAESVGERAPWAHPNVARHAAQRYGFAPESLTGLRAYATVAAPVRGDLGRLPVLVFSPGDGGNRTDNTALTEDLASHGYLVIAVDHLGDALEGSLPDGELVPRSKPELPERTRAEELTGPAVVAQVDVRVADVSAVLDALGRVEAAARSAADPHPRSTATPNRSPAVEGDPSDAGAGPQVLDRAGAQGVLPAGLPGRIDLTRLGVLGHSLGGATAAAALFGDDRLRAGVNLDGLVAGPVATEGLDRPFLVLRQPLHTTAIDPSWRTFLPALRGWHRVVTVAGAGHYSFADLGLWTGQAGVALRTTRETYRFNFGTGDNIRATELVRALVRGFFDTHLRSRPVPPLLAGPTADNPELTFD